MAKLTTRRFKYKVLISEWFIRYFFRNFVFVPVAKNEVVEKDKIDEAAAKNHITIMRKLNRLKLCEKLVSGISKILTLKITWKV